MPRRKQDCPKRRDMTQDFSEDTKIPARLDDPLDLSTKRKLPETNKKPKTESPVQGVTVKRPKLGSVDENPVRTPTTSKDLDKSKLKFPTPIFSAAMGYYPNPFALHPFASPFNFPTSPLMPLRLPTCPASTPTSSCTAAAFTTSTHQALLQPTFPVPTSSKNSNSTSKSNDSLDKLSDLVQTVGSSAKGSSIIDESISDHESKSPNTTNSDVSVSESGMTMQELWWKYMKKEESAELKRINEAKQIFTCLQCQQSFQSMDQLVKHMEVTQHFTNVPKHYSWSLQYARQKMRQMKLKLKYSERMMYFCHLCAAPFTVAVHQHFSETHDMHNPVDNMNFVQIVMVNGGDGASGSRILKQHSTDSGNQQDRSTPTPGSSCGSSDRSSPVFLSPNSTSKQTVLGAFKDFVDCNRSPTNVTGEKKNVKSQNASTDNLLLKMEELVKSAVDQTYQKTRKTSSEDTAMPLPASKLFSVFPSPKKNT